MNRRVLTAIAAIAAVAVAALIILGGSNDDYLVRAEFKDVGGLRKNASVKVAGVPAGKVKEIDITKRDTAIATLRIKKEAAPIGEGASVNVRPTDLLGEHYAEVKLGDTSRPLPSNSFIPINRTAVPVELDDILNIFDADTRTRLGILVNEIGIGLHGRGFDLNKLIRQMPNDLEQGRKLLAEIAAQNRTLKDVLVGSDLNTAAMNAKREDLGKLIDEASGGLAGVAAKRRELGSTIQNAPAGLRELRTTLSQLRSASVSLRPFAGDLQRAARPLNRTLRTLPSFADAAAPTLRTATDVAPSLTRLGTRATPTVKRLRPTAKVLANTLKPAKAIVDQLDLRAVDDILYFIRVWAGAMRPRDALGHQISVHLNFDSNYVTSMINSLNTPSPTTSAKRAPSSKPQVPSVGLPSKGGRPTLRLPDKVTKLPKEVLEKVAPQAIHQATDAVKGLLGGAVVNRKSNGSAPPILGGLRHAQPRQNTAGSDALRLFDYLMGP